MNALIKIFSLLVVLFTVYLLTIFIVPDFADSVGDELGIRSFNTWIRELKGGADTISDDLLQIKTASGVLDSAREAAQKTNDFIKKTQEGISTTKQVIETKVEQVNKVADSISKTRDAATELQNNIKDLTSFDSGATATGATTSLAQ